MNVGDQVRYVGNINERFLRYLGRVIDADQHVVTVQLGEKSSRYPRMAVTKCLMGTAHVVTSNKSKKDIYG